MKPQWWALPGIAWLMGGCSDGGAVEHVSAIERGQRLFEDGSASVVGTACSSCHPSPDGDPSRLYPGADLSGVSGRTSFWGGQENDLLRSLNHCRTLFQGAETPLQAEEPDAGDLYAFLDSMSGSADAVAFTIVKTVEALPAGDATAGLETYNRACRGCHGAPHSGDGRLADAIPALPEDPLSEHAYLDASEQTLLFIEKVRHGGFLGYSGFMPPFSLETLSDPELGDVLSALGLAAP